MIVTAAITAATLQLMVVGPSGNVMRARSVTRAAATLRVRGRRCRVAGGTPLAALAHARLSLRVRDYGACGARAADSASLFVARIGRTGNRGRNGWVWKSGPRTSSLGAGDPSARLAAGANVLWFFCHQGAHGCQRTLAVSAPTSVSRRGRLRVQVTGYDDAGRGVGVRGATVRLGAVRARTGAGGVATLRAPRRRGEYRLLASRRGMVRAFGVRVRVG
jgi:hypothetical protein